MESNIHSNVTPRQGDHDEEVNLPLLSARRTWTGHWWLPDAPEERVPGRLTYEPGKGLRLELIGGWEYRVMTHNADGSSSVYAAMQSWDVVYGEAEAKRITLIDTHVTEAKTFGFKMREPDQLELMATTALVGCHLDDPEGADFVGGIATIENLTAWSRTTGLEIHHSMSEDGKRLIADGEIHHRAVDSLVAQVGSVTAKLHQLLTLPSFRTTRSGTTGRVEERFAVEFSSETARPMQDWLDMLSSITDLVSLSTLSACADITVHLFAPPTPNAYPEDHPLKNERHQVEVFERRLRTPEPDQKGASHRDFVLTLDDLPFADLIPRWMAVKDQFTAARAMILGLRYVTAGYLETRVFTAVGAAESMHRSLDLAPPMTPAEFKALKKTVMDAVAPGQRQWAAERVGRNEPGLKTRLLELAARPGAFMSVLVPDPERWATAATRARNNLAHVGLSDQHSFDELHAVVEVTAAVVILNLLSELGVPVERMQRALNEHPELSEAVRLSKEHFST
jgi:hypothetical protein